MARVTRKAISKAIKEKHGLDVEIIRDPSGYHYFFSDDEETGLMLARWYATSVYVNRLTDLSVERWVEEFTDMMEENKDR